jgi:hypothetical protein
LFDSSYHEAASKMAQFNPDELPGAGKIKMGGFPGLYLVKCESALKLALAVFSFLNNHQ